MANYESEYMQDFDRAIKQAEAITKGGLDPFTDQVIIDDGDEYIDAGPVLSNEGNANQISYDAAVLDDVISVNDGPESPGKDKPKKTRGLDDDDEDM